MNNFKNERLFVMKKILISIIAAVIASTSLYALPAGTSKFGKMRDKDYVVTNGWQAVEANVAIATNEVSASIFNEIKPIVSNAVIEAQSAFNNWTNSDYIVAGKNAKINFDTSLIVGQGGTIIEPSNDSIVLGKNAEGGSSAVAIGANSYSSNNSASIGYQAKAEQYGTALGFNAEAQQYSASIGYQAKAEQYGMALGAVSIFSQMDYSGGGTIGTSRIAGSYAEQFTLGIAYSPSNTYFDSYSGSYDRKSLQAYLDEKANTKDTYTKTEIDYMIDEAGKVKSVNGKTGVVVLDADDISALPATKSSAEYTVANDTRFTTKIYADGLLTFSGNQPIKVNAGSLNFLDNEGQVSPLYPDGSKIMTKDVGDAAYVPLTRTVNSKALSGNIVLSASDINAVPTTRTVNSKALSSDITLGASDVGAYAKADTYTKAEIDSKFSTDNAAFTNAVLSTVMNVDTNYVADINSLVDDKVKLPLTGTAGIGALLTALAAAVSKLKKSKANQTDLDNLSATVGEANDLLESVA